MPEICLNLNFNCLIYLFRFELPVSVLGKGTTFSNFVEVVQRSESENAESSQLVSQQVYSIFLKYLGSKIEISIHIENIW